ncbi:MAG: DUF1491 family protein [Hyphomicrobiaceae bacterium]|nr:DUF1491 family protein [Hyphomicrobiaceae bacterium]
MRLKAEIWVKAYLRTCANAGASGVVVRHGDDDAGAVFIKVRTRDGLARLFGPAPAGLDGQDSLRAWTAHLAPDGAPEADIDAYLDQQSRFDPDLWIIEIEDAHGRHYLDDWLAR